MDEQQLKNQSEAFEKSSRDKGLKTVEKINDKKKKAQKAKRIIKILLNPITWKILAVIVIAIGGIVLTAGIIDVIGIGTQNETNEAKKGAVSVSMSSPSSGENTNNTAIVIKPTQKNDSYEITTTYDDENIDDIRKELDEKYSNDLSDFNDFDTKIIAGLEENGLDLDSYTTEELKCLPAFLKAESCTQFLDLRPNNQKFDSSGKYKPKQMSELGENEVPGIILVQRTNTRETTPITLEYKKLEEFNTLVSNNDINVKNYFTINEKGNLVIAKWSNTKITLDGNYPQNLPEYEKVEEKDETIIITEEISYSQYVAKYTMPFDFLTQLLVITEDPKFCLEVADIVLGSKIVINIQEEETITTTTEIRTYEVHSKENKYLDYNVEPDLESEVNHFINPYNKEDENGNKCTTYEYDEKEVTITTTNTSHTYQIGISEADTWIMRYYEKYDTPTKKPKNNPIQPIDIDGEYEAGEEKVITNSEQILNDKETEKFKEDKEKDYKENIPKVTVKVETNKKGLLSDKNYKEIVVTPKNKVITNLSQFEFDEIEVKDDKGNVIGYKYDMPSEFIVTTIKTKECPFEVRFKYSLNSDYQYIQSGTNKDDILKCNISKLLVKPYTKINLKGTIKTDIVEYISDPNPEKHTYMYVKDTNGNFEKFLKAYDNNKKAVELMRDVDSWLFEMMADNENTKKLVPVIKVLLYEYDGIDRGITELDLSMFEGDKFITSTSGGLVVKTDAVGALTPLTKEQLIQIIEKRFSGQAKENLLEVIDYLIYIQDTYKVNAVFAIAVTQVESSCGTNWAAIDSSTHNWCSIKGSYNGKSYNGWKSYPSFGEAIRDFGNLIANSSYYFKNGNITPRTIGPTYCDEKWGETTGKYVTEMYESIGIAVYSNEGNEIQQKVAEVAKSSQQYGIIPISGYCQKWIAEVYYASGANEVKKSQVSARVAGYYWGASTNWQEIQVGATVYGYGNSKYGHVGIYIGDGMVAHNVGYVAFDDLETWIKKHNGVCWGWNGGTDLTGGLYPCQEGLISK